jgi:hypothetical protein
VYCNQGDKPTVNYTFGDGTKGKFIANTAPVDVVTSIEPATQNTYTYFDPNLPGSRQAQGNSYATEFLSFCQQGQQAIRIFNNGVQVLFSCYLPGSLSFISGTQERCVLRVSNTSGASLFTTKGACPVSFTVACGNCPPGFIEHKIAEYPGYCCMDCAGIRNQIQSITAAVRGINRG